MKKNNSKSLVITLLEYFPVFFIWHIIHPMPFFLKITFGRFGGWVTYWSLKNYREIVRSNLKIALPKRSFIEENKFIKRTFIHFGKMIMEFIASYRLFESQIRKKCIVSEKTKKVLNEMRNSEKGCIVYSCHHSSYYWNLFLLNSFLNENHLWREDKKQNNNPISDAKAKKFI